MKGKVVEQESGICQPLCDMVTHRLGFVAHPPGLLWLPPPLISVSLPAFVRFISFPRQTALYPSKSRLRFFPLSPESPWGPHSPPDFDHHFYIPDAWISRNSLVLNIKLLLPTAFRNLFHTFFKLNLSRRSLSVPTPVLLPSFSPVIVTIHHVSLGSGREST